MRVSSKRTTKLWMSIILALALALGGCSSDKSKCGNGERDPGETCDGDCPTTCDDSDACTVDTLTGSAANCDAECSYEPVTDCINGDDCCPTGCNEGNDDDCADPCAGVTDCINDDGCCPTGCDSGNDNDCADPCAGITDCINGDGCCPTGCVVGNDNDCTDPCDGVTDCINDDGCCPTGCDSGNDNDCADPCDDVTDCIDDDGCCPMGCSSGNDNDCLVACDTIADVRAAADGAADLNLCSSLVTYAYDSGYFLQADPTGPAIYVYEGTGWVADVAVGDEVTLHITELGDYNGVKEITAHDPVQVLSSGNPVTPLIQDLSAGTTPLSEDLESELVSVSGITLTAIDGQDLTVSYGAATDVSMRIGTGTALSFCVGATFDFLGVVTEFNTLYQLRSYMDSDFTNFDTTNCAQLGRPPVPGDLVLNEFLADPPPDVAGDANCDGTRDGTEDEFLEIVNVSGEALDLSGVTISDSIRVRYTFLDFGLDPGELVVVFGGGDPQCTWFANVHVLTSNGLSLNNAGDTITIADANGTELIAHTYDTVAGNANASMTLSPDLNTGAPYVAHDVADIADNSPFSPGAQIDGTQLNP